MIALQHTKYENPEKGIWTARNKENQIQCPQWRKVQTKGVWNNIKCGIKLQDHKHRIPDKQETKQKQVSTKSQERKEQITKGTSCPTRKKKEAKKETKQIQAITKKSNTTHKKTPM